MDKWGVRKILNAERATETQIRIMYKILDVIVRWSGYDGGYWKVVDIAKDLRITRNTVYNQLKLFKYHFPDGFKLAQEQREIVKRVSERQYESKRRPESWDQLKEHAGDEIENHVKEKF